MSVTGQSKDGNSPPAWAEIDRDRMLANVGGDESLLKEVAGLFLHECPRLLERIEAAIVTGDSAGLEMAAHSLKGSAGVFSADGVYAAAEKLEVMGRDGDLAGAGAVFSSLADETRQLQAALADVCGLPPLVMTNRD